MDIFKTKYLKYKSRYKKLKQELFIDSNNNTMNLELNLEQLNLEQTGGRQSKNIIYMINIIMFI